MIYHNRHLAFQMLPTSLEESFITHLHKVKKGEMNSDQAKPMLSDESKYTEDPNKGANDKCRNEGADDKCPKERADRKCQNASTEDKCAS